MTMRLWHDPSAAAAERSCCSPETVRLARAGAHALGHPAPHPRRRRALPARAWSRTSSPATARGAPRTPASPATGACASACSPTPPPCSARGCWPPATTPAWSATPRAPRSCRRAADAGKDQSYMLAMLDRAHRERLVFPLGDLRKDDVRAMARAAGAARRRRGREPGGLLRGRGRPRPVPRAHRRALAPRPGPIEDAAGRLPRAPTAATGASPSASGGASASPAPEPLYVLATDAARNAVVVGTARGAGRATPSTLGAARACTASSATTPLEVRLRYRGRPLRGRARGGGPGGLRVELRGSRRRGRPGADRGAVPRRAPGRGGYHRAVADDRRPAREDEWTGLTY